MPTRYHRKNNGYINRPHQGGKNPPTGTDADLNLATMAGLFSDENKAREFLEAKRWPDGPHCPHCGEHEPYKLEPKATSKRPVRPGVYKCRGCRKQFTVRIGTIFEESKIPLRKWLMAIHLMTSSKKGVSSHQIAREVGVTQKTAWFLCHRIREAMREEPLSSMIDVDSSCKLSGIIEADETYVGGKPRYKGKGTRGRPGENSNKKPLLVLIERDGRAVAKPVDNVSSKELQTEFDKYVDKGSSRLMTDEWPSYRPIGKEFASHEVVKHLGKEFARGDVHCNSAESFFALLKRGHYGIFHQLSKEHLHRYCNEFSFRWSHRKISDGERMVKAIEGAEGKRLMLNAPKRDSDG